MMSRFDRSVPICLKMDDGLDGEGSSKKSGGSFELFILACLRRIRLWLML